MNKFKNGQTVVFKNAFDLKNGRFYKDEVGYVSKNNKNGEIRVRIPRDVFLVIPKEKEHIYAKIFDSIDERNKIK